MTKVRAWEVNVAATCHLAWTRRTTRGWNRY